MENSIKGVTHLFGLFIISLMVFQITLHKFDYYKEQGAALANSNTSTKVVEQGLNCLAMNVYREAGSEPFEGKVAVAQITLNRANDSRFPKDICGVVHQKNVFMEKVVCQFSWYCDSATRAKPINNSAYRESMEVAKKVLLEGFRLPSLEKALYFHGSYINPNWNKPRVAKIGNHIFYKD
jgi:hypothetical protein